MSYDRQGRRVTKNDQRFVYEGYLQIADNGGNAYIWNPTEPVATLPLVWNLSTFQPFNFSTSYYTHDGNKNVSEVIAANGDVVAHYEYAPFGAVIAQHGASAAANPWRFSSEYAEDDSATIYYNYRHYEPVMGRWMSRDPIEEEGGVNLYLSCFNAMTFLQDVLGKSISDWFICMGDCIEDNDPLDKFFEKLLGQMLGGVWPKSWVAKVFESLGNSGYVDPKIAAEIRKLLKAWKVSRMTTVPSALALLVQKIPVKHFLRSMGASLSYFWTAYGYYMLQVESACAGACCGASTYDPNIGIFLFVDINTLLEAFKRSVNGADNF